MKRLALAIALVAMPAAASVPDLFGYGARSSALAGAGAADAAGFEACWANPAGLTDAARPRLTLGWLQGGSALRLDGAARPIEDAGGATVGAAVPLPFRGALANRLALGLGLYFPSRVTNRALAPFPSEPRLALLDARTQVVTVLLAGSLRITDRISIGAGVNALATLLAQIQLQADASNRIVALVDERLAWATAPIAGVRFRPIDDLKLGVTLRGASQAGYDLRITSSLGTALPIGVPDLRVAGSSQFDPLQVQAEGALRPSERVTLFAGATLKHWSAFPYPTENATAATPPEPPTGYSDTLVPRAAIEASFPWADRALQLRGGYLYEPSPAPRDAPTLIDASRHVLAAGAGLTLPIGAGALQLDAFAQLHQLAGSPRASGRLWIAGATVGVDL